jgi:hypothetical protein
LRLQFFQIANAVYHPANFQQRIQVPGQAGVCRQLTQYTFGLEIERVLGPQLRRGLRSMVVEPLLAGVRLVRLFSQEQDENRIADGDLVTVMQRTFLHRHSVYECAVAAIEIANLVAVSVPCQHAMAARK